MGCAASAKPGAYALYDNRRGTSHPTSALFVRIASPRPSIRLWSHSLRTGSWARAAALAAAVRPRVAEAPGRGAEGASERRPAGDEAAKDVPHHVWSSVSPYRSDE